MSSAGVSLDLVRGLRAICGPDYVTESPDGGLNVYPASADETAAILRLANERGIGVIPAGGGSDPIVSRGHTEVVLHTDRLTEVEHYDPADLTVGIGAGMTVSQLNAMLHADHLMFACDPPLADRATIGGILASNAQGPMRHGYGALRDFCIGIRFVTGDGRKAKGGGRVVKNVAGYDLMKLLIGSNGGLAVITSASFKLFPTPRQTRTFIAEFATLHEALKFRDKIVGSPVGPMCLELISPRARSMMRPGMTDDVWVICVRGAGSDAVLARYRQELGSAVTRELAGEPEVAMWKIIENFPASAPSWSSPATFYLSASQLAETLESLHEEYRAAVIGRIGVGNLVVSFPQRDGQIQGSMSPNMSPVTSADRRFQGRSYGLKADQVSAMRAVRQALDPNNVLRGRELF